jgi:hypothetical protein
VLVRLYRFVVLWGFKGVVLRFLTRYGLIMAAHPCPARRSCTEEPWKSARSIGFRFVATARASHTSSAVREQLL